MFWICGTVGCSNFFQCEEKAACPSDGGGTGPKSNEDYAFVAYTSSGGQSQIVGFTLTDGTLKVITTASLPFVPVAMVLNPANTRLYVASAPASTSPGIYEYLIGTTGALTSANSGAAVASDLVGALAISPDGGYLYTIQSTGQTLTQYSVNGTTGALTSDGVLVVPGISCGLVPSTPVLPACSIAVSPTKDRVVASLGTQGDAVFGYSSSNGLLNNGRFAQISPSAGSGDFSVSLDSNARLYIGQTSSVTAWNLATSAFQNLGSLTFTGNSTPRNVLVDPSSKYLFVAEVGASQVAGYTIGTSTALSSVSGSPYIAPPKVIALGVDNTDSYLVAAGYDAAAGIQLYAISNSGRLVPIATAGTTSATQNPVLVAMSH